MLRASFLISIIGIAGIAEAMGERVGLPGNPPVATARSSRASGQLSAFGSDAELRAYLERRLDLEKKFCPDGTTISKRQNCPAMPPPQEHPSAPTVSSDIVAPAPPEPEGGDGITNIQEAGVDEGGIVKKRGDLLIILRRGRLFTVSIAAGQMRAIDRINAFPPGVAGSGGWYDEMLVSGDRVIVIGYNSSRGGTEVNRFRLSPAGQLRFEDSYQLRSNDYYSSRNYASRLIGNRLVYYTPLYLNRYGGDPFESFPALRRWDLNRWQRGGEARFHRVARAQDVYVIPSLRDDDEVELDTLHSVMNCDLTAQVMTCKATAVLGPASRTFYVSPTAVYLWVSNAGHWRAAGRVGARSWLYRMPLDGSQKPSAIGTNGQPTDQFSFREDSRLGLIDVLVRSGGGGDAMWNSEAGDGSVALLSVPIAWMGDGGRPVARSRYRPLPSVGADASNFQNRFVGNHIIYGGHGYSGGQQSLLVAAGLRGGPVAQLQLPHGVERLDQLGDDGVVIGNDVDGGLTFTAVDLRQPMARMGNSFTFPNAQQGENRSQAFFYRPDSRDGASGLLGLPIATRLETQYARFLGSGSSILFLTRANRLFKLAGRLDSDPYKAVDDSCVASCVDWYGNARPIFVGNRVFALMGYELVEGRLEPAPAGRGGTGRPNHVIREAARINFAPQRTKRREGAL